MKIFFSQAMRGREEKDILAEREVATKMLKAKYGDDIEIIDSYNPNCEPMKNTPVWCLGRSLQKLAEADLCVMISDCTYDLPRGCSIEQHVCIEYGIPYAILFNNAYTNKFAKEGED